MSKKNSVCYAMLRYIFNRRNNFTNFRSLSFALNACYLYSRTLSGRDICHMQDYLDISPLRDNFYCVLRVACPVIANALMSPSAPSTCDKVEIQCKTGYVLIYPHNAYLECGTEGTWNEKVECLPAVQVVDDTNSLTTDPHWTWSAKYYELLDMDPTTCIMQNSTAVKFGPKRASQITILGKELNCNPTDGQLSVFRYNPHCYTFGCNMKVCIPFMSAVGQNYECKYLWFVLIVEAQKEAVITICEISVQ